MPMRLTLLFCVVPTLLAAQLPDSVARHAIPITDSVLRLSADRASDLLPWMAGGGLDADGAPTWHGARVTTFEQMTDGVRWASALRSSGVRGDGAIPVVLEPGLNSISAGEVRDAGRSPATLGFTTRSGATDRWGAVGGAESESPLRAGGGMGISRFEGAFGGPLGGGFRLRVSGTVLGREHAPTGPGYGDTPLYLPTGIDTVMRFPDASTLPDSIDALVQRFGPTDGLPYTPHTAADWAVRLDGTVGRAELWARWLGTRRSERFLTYDLSNPSQATGRNGVGRDIAAGVRLLLTSSMRVDGTLALQHERSERGPLASPSELDSRDPTLGLLLGGLDLMFSMDNFPLDDELLNNYRNNTPGSRRSPYDLENTAQYALEDRYRNNAFGLLGWSERGGPTGRLAFYQDTRTMAQGGVTWGIGPDGALRLGAEIVRHDVKNYAHTLTSQAFSDVWYERPTETALTADWMQTSRGWTFEAGLRVDRFASGASRPFFLDTFATSATQGEYHFYPRHSSYGSGSSTLRRYIEDEGHAMLAPRLAFRGALPSGVILFGSGARTGRMPDLAYLFDGLNTDLAITNFSDAFGTDMGHEVVDVVELGAKAPLGELRLDGTIFLNRFPKLVTSRLVSLFDPARGTNNDIRVHQMAEGGSTRGLTLAAELAASSMFRVRGAYTFTDPVELNIYWGAFPVADFRRHVLAVTAQFESPASTPLAGLGVVASVRAMSGAARSIDPGTDPFAMFGAIRTAGIPAWTSLDLRVAKRFAWGGSALSVYLDGRNLLNAENVLRAFGYGDPARAAGVEALEWSNDSAGYANEAQRNGLYDGAGSIDLTFGGADRGGCGAWQTASGSPAPPNCAYLIAAEERFGDGDGVFSVTEQRAASMSFYRSVLGSSAFSGPGRAIRIGVQLRF